jgi:hypothetical protein
MNGMTRLATFCGSLGKSMCGPSTVAKPMSGLTRRISLSQDADSSLSWEARKYITDRLVGSDYFDRWADLDYSDRWEGLAYSARLVGSDYLDRWGD